jgi:glycosyltransferase involved in cell wall biosynthesis
MASSSPRLIVLHVTQPLLGGVDRCVAQLIADQSERGWSVAVACRSDSEAANAARDSRADLHEWTASRLPGPATAAEISRLRRIVRQVSPDLVHLHSAKAGLAGRLVVRGRLPTLFQPHSWSWHAVEGSVRRLTVGWERWAARWCDAILCVSEAERALGNAARLDAVFHVIHNGVDPRAISASPPESAPAFRARLGLPVDAPLVVCVGRLTRQKGQDVLLGAWRDVLREVPAARLALVGSGPAEQLLRSSAPRAVTFAGEQERVVDWLAAADVVAVPSRWDGMSLALLEAMAAGRSVVATDVPGAAEALGDSAGAIVALSPAAIGGAIVERLRDPARAAAEGREGRRRIESRFDVAQTLEAVAAVYRAVLAVRSEAGEGWSSGSRRAAVAQ